MVNKTREGALDTLEETQEDTAGTVEQLAEAILDTGSGAENATAEMMETIIVEVDEGAEELIDEGTGGRGSRRYMRVGGLILLATAIGIGVLAGMYLRRRASAGETDEFE